MKRLAAGCVLAACQLAAQETQVLFGEGVEAPWDSARDAARLQQELSASDLAVDAAGSLSWRFVSRGPTFNDIFLRRRLERPFTALELEVENRGEPFRLAAKVRDARGAEWTVEPVALATGEGRTVSFPRGAWQPASWSKDADGELDYPLEYLAVIAFGVVPGASYDLAIRRVAAVIPPTPTAAVAGLRLPARLTAGETVALSFSVTLDTPCLLPGAALEVRADGRPSFSRRLDLPKPLSAWLPGETVAVSDLRVDVPRFARGGDVSVHLRLGEARVRLDGEATDDNTVARVFLAARQPGAVTSGVAPHGGVPTLVINGRPHAGMAYAAYGPSTPVFRDFAAAGVNLFSICGTPTESGYGLSRSSWTAPDVFDFSQLDERILMVLEADPEAFIFPRLYLHAPPWWSAQHPDECVLADPGDGRPVPFIHSGGKPAPSWASQPWRRDTIAALRRLVRHVESSPYADRVIGYHLASGTTEEWMMWGANEREWVDYSPANLAHFRRWLRQRHPTLEALRAAWRDPEASWESAAIPSRRQREAAALGALRDPAVERQVIDFTLYNSDLVAETIALFAGAVKEMTGRSKLVGVFYGYTLQLCGEPRQQNAGHLALAQVLACPDVDFLCSPTSYAFRQLGGKGTSHFMSLTASVAAHGKLWFNENDVRTSLAPGEPGGWGKPADVAGDILQQDKELANAVVNGAAQWWFDVGRNRYDDPDLMRRLGELVRVAALARDLDRTPVDEAAFVVDERSLAWLRTGHPLGRHLLVGQLPELHRFGAPVGHYLASDLDRCRRHRLVILPASFAPDAAQRAAVDALKADGRVLVFLYAPGVYRDDTLQSGAAEAFCGIRLQRLDPAPKPLRVTLLAGADPLLPEGLAYGCGDAVEPVFAAADPEAQVLGVLPDGSPGLVLRRYPGWTAVFSAAPLLPAPIWRRLAEMAGVHRYTDTPDVVWACRDLLAVCVDAAGERRISLPEPARVTDLLGSGATVAASAGALAVPFGPQATRVFRLERPAVP